MRRDRRTVREWVRAGAPPPPPEQVKRRLVRALAREHRLRVFVETGTFRGDMVEAMRRRSARIFSIELDRERCEQARRRFSRDARVTILHGDSGAVLPRVLAELDRPALFWLDGHYSGHGTARGNLETPILTELDHVLGHRVEGHVVLVDDARLFDGAGHYPTLADLAEYVLARRPNAQIDVRDDIIRIV